MTQQQQPENGLEYQLKLLKLEAIHYQQTGGGARFLVKRALQVADQAAALTAAREALETALQTLQGIASEEGDTRFWNDEGEGRETCNAIRAALQQLNGEAQP